MITQGADIWEGNTVLNPTLVATFCKFMYLRTWGGNLAVGKEKDKLFDVNWAKFKDIIPRGTYFEVQPETTVEDNVERYKRVYPTSDPSEIPDWIVYEIASSKSRTQLVDESTLIYERIMAFLGYNPWIYTGRWYWDYVLGYTALANRTEFVIASYYWNKEYARSRIIYSYNDLAQFVPPGWTSGVLGDIDAPVGYQWTGDQFVFPGITGYTDGVEIALSIEQMKAARLGVIPTPEPLPDPIAYPSYIELTSNAHALNVPYISQIGQGANLHHNDCGAACVSMLISAYTQQNISVDEVYAKIQPNGDTYLSVVQLKNALAQYGINTVASSDLSKEYYWSRMLEAKPSIALISYKPIFDAGLADEGVTFVGYHFIVVIGLDVDGVLIHDPLFTTDKGGFRHIPYDVYKKAISYFGAGVLLTALNPLGGVHSQGISYLVTVAERYIRTEPNTITGIRVEIKYKGDTVSISEINANNWGRLTGTTNWMYMPGLVKI